jgi:hypothetical protein
MRGTRPISSPRRSTTNSPPTNEEIHVRGNRYEAIAERLAAIEEELRDLAYERLTDSTRDPDSDAGAVAAADEKRLLQARRAIAKAIQALSMPDAD